MKPSIKQQNQRDFIFSLIVSKPYRWVRHLLLITIVYTITLFNNNPVEFSGHYKLYNDIFSGTLLTLCFYINMYILVPRTIYTNKYTKYIGSIMVLGLLCLIITYGFNQLVLEPNRILPKKEDVSFFIAYPVFMLVIFALILPSTALKIVQRWAEDLNRINELEKKALESEVAALRNQINPHFVFNILNNVNVLISKDPDKASQVIVKFSDFLRYHLYENNEPLVFLSAEIRFITDFLNIESIRREQFQCEIKQDRPVYLGIKVPSNLLITFVENAVKYSADPNQPSSIRISFEVIGNEIVFTCINSKPARNTKRNGPGIGLANARRRLELHYQDQYEMKTDELPNQYTIQVKMPL